MAYAQSTPAASARRTSKRKFRAWPLVTLLAVVALAWFGWVKTHPAANPLGSVITAQVTRGDLTESISATGSVTAQTGAEVKIGSQITGRIRRLYADVGSYVHAGQVIAELDLPDVQAQLNQALSNLAMASARVQQDETALVMQRTQSSSAVAQAQAALASAQAKLSSARAAARQQVTQTPTDIRRAETSLATARAALSTARSNLAQVRASANLQIASARDQVKQTQATAANSAVALRRNQDLLAKGYVAQSVVDQAQATDAVNQSMVDTAQQNVQLIQAKVAADQQTAADQVTQAQEAVSAAQAALTSARAGTYSDVEKQAAANDALAAVNQARANLAAAMGNTGQNMMKQQDIAQAQDAVRTAQAQVEFNRAQVDKTSIRSPISGTVLQLAAQQGETLAAGLSAPTLIIVADLKRLQVDAYVDETDIGKVRKGQSATVTVDAFPHHAFKGTVLKVASGSTIQQGVVTYDVTIGIEGAAGRLKPDMTASVNIQTGTRHNVLLVPAEAVKIGAHGSTVNVPDGTGDKMSVKPVKVRTGASDGVNTEIRDGLKEGQTIVVAGGDQARRGGGPQSPFGPSNNRGGGGGGRRGG